MRYDTVAMTTKEVTKKIRNLERTMEALYREVTLLRTQASDRQHRVLQKTAGALKHKIKGNPILWQRRIRQDRQI